ncbi:aldehyde-activating protein [Novosphingobium barchaimii]|nr:aldehyde-activating protein [Novosphingobium barchaimii]
MSEREARCQCGQLRIRTQGDPMRVSVCHCLECKRRSGSAFAVQARFPVENVQITSNAHQWSRTGDEGKTATFSFCPGCGSTVFYRFDADPTMIAVAVGAFADPTFPAPIYSVYEERRHPWVTLPADIERYD